MRLIKPLLALSLVAGPALTATAQDTLPPIARWLPPQTLAVLEIRKPGAILDFLLHPGRLAAITALPAWKKASGTKQIRQLLQLVGFLEKRLGQGWRPALQGLLAGGVTLAIGPDKRALLAVDTGEGQLMTRLHKAVLALVEMGAPARGGQAALTQERYQDQVIWRFAQGGAYTFLGKRLLLADRRSTLQAILDLRAKPTGQSLAGSAPYLAAMEALPPRTAARAFVHLKPLKGNPGFAKALAGKPNPMAALLIAGLGRSLATSNWIALGAHAARDILRLEVRVDAKAIAPPDPASFGTSAAPGEGVLPNLRVPRRIAAGTLFRDLYRFYAAKDKLFPERTSALIFFENMMGIYFSGRDLTEEVFGEMKPGARFVVAEQHFDPKRGTPAVRYPAFALVLRLKNPSKYGIVVEEAWQEALGMINFTRGQKGQAGLIIDRLEHEGTRFSVAYFSAADVKDRSRLEGRFNFRPSLVVFGDNLILSSTDDLARDLITSLKAQARAGGAKTSPGTDTFLEINGSRVASILRANRTTMVRRTMIDDGATAPQAEGKVDLIHTLVGLLDRAILRTGSRDGRPVASLTLILTRGR